MGFAQHRGHRFIAVGMKKFQRVRFHSRQTMFTKDKSLHGNDLKSFYAQQLDLLLDGTLRLRGSISVFGLWLRSPLCSFLSCLLGTELNDLQVPQWGYPRAGLKEPLKAYASITIYVQQTLRRTSHSPASVNTSWREQTFNLQSILFLP